MTKEQREQLLDLNERLCKEYTDTDDPLVLERISVTEVLLFNDPDQFVPKMVRPRRDANGDVYNLGALKSWDA